MDTMRFDRHADMSKETVDEIMEIINVRETRKSFNVKNSLFGLFDGYLYSDLLPEAKETFSPELSNRIEAVVNEIKQYPSLK